MKSALIWKDGYLTVSAAKGVDKDEKDNEGRYIRRERYSGSMTRSFYVAAPLPKKILRLNMKTVFLSLSIPKKRPESR